MKKALILANGLHPKKTVIEYLQNNGYKTLVCADGGANSAYKLKLIPEFIIGDLDSINPNVKKFYEKKSKIIKYERQNDTDVEKCLKFIIKKNYDEVILLGATGDRLDHSFCNMGIVLKFFNEIKINILHQKSFLNCFTGKVVLNTLKDEIISLYGFDKKTKIKSVGLKYPLEIVRDFNTLRKNGYFQQP